MKMKKLLAGVLSAAMVATMIPASMAFSVSAAPEAAYDYSFVGKELNADGWTTAGTRSQDASITEAGLSLVGDQSDESSSVSYSIANPLQGKAENGFSVRMTLSVTDDIDAFQSIFGFSDAAAPGDADWSFFSVSGDGLSMHKNCAGYWDLNATSTLDMTAMSEYVLTVSGDGVVNVYLNGENVATYTSASITAGDWENPTVRANAAAYFNVGAAANCYANATMTVESVTLYASELSADEVAGGYISYDYNFVGK